MSKSLTTKTAIFESFRTLLIESQSGSVTVQDLTTSCGISRKTFYYHFPDQLTLMEWGFRQGIAQRLRDQCAKESLVGPIRQMSDPFPDLPYYACSPSGVRSIDGANFFEIFTDYLEAYRTYYYKLLTGQSSANFVRYILSIYYYAFYRDVKFIVGGRSVGQETLVKFTRYFLHSSISSYLDEILYFNTPLTNCIPEETPNFHHDALRDAIDRYFSADEKRYRFPKLHSL